MAGLGGKSLYQVKGLFFDKAGLEKAVDKTRYKFLSKAGAFVMTAARRLIRKSKKPSSPGQPPKGHGQQLLRKGIFFALDKPNDDCLAGPIQLNQVNHDKDGQPVKGTVPSILEHGGSIWIKEVFRFGKWRRVDGRRRKDTYNGLPMRLRKVTIEARPFMGPALAESKPKFAPMMAGLYKKG